jgi:hypothetical protein
MCLQICGIALLQSITDYEYDTVADQAVSRPRHILSKSFLFGFTVVGDLATFANVGTNARKSTDILTGFSARLTLTSNEASAKKRNAPKPALSHK